MPLFKDIPPPSAEASVAEAIEWAAKRDPVGHRIHLVLAVFAMASIPLSSTLATISSTILFGYTLLRAPTLWRTWRTLPANPVILAVIAMYVWLAISLLWSPNPDQGVRLLRGSRYLLLIPALVPMLNQARILLFGLTLGALIQFVAQVTDLLVTNNNEVSGGLSTHPGHTGLWYSLAIGTALLLAPHSVQNLTIRVPIAALILVGLVMTGARSAVAGTLLGITCGALILFGRIKEPRNKIIFATTVFVLLLGTVVLSFQSHLSNRISDFYTAQVIDQNPETFNTENNRTLWWQIGLREWKDRPVLGYGLGSAEELITTDPEVISILENANEERVLRDDFHSTFITTLVETGVVGLLLFCVWMLCLLRSVLASDSIAPVLLAGMVAYLGYAVFNTTLFSGRLVAFSSTLIALSIIPVPNLDKKFFESLIPRKPDEANLLANPRSGDNAPNPEIGRTTDHA